jgi:hypothetical protein
MTGSDRSGVDGYAQGMDEQQQDEREPEPSEGSAAQPDDGDNDFIPDADAGRTDAAKYSRDEKDHGRQDYGP